MNFKQKLAYIGLGGFLVSVGYILATGGNGVGALAQQTVIDEIVCRELTVVDAEGKPAVLLSVNANGGIVSVHGKDENGIATLRINEHGGVVSAYGKGRKGSATLRINERGGIVSVHGKGREITRQIP